MFNRCKSHIGLLPHRAHRAGRIPFFRKEVLLSVFLGLSFSSSLYAWGEAGHRIVADVAERHLTQPARQEVERLLEGASLASIAAWADRIRGDRPETAPWHYVNIPFKASRYNPNRDCLSPAEGDCLIAAIARFKRVLADRARPLPERAEALKFLVHLVGDLHQPLHTINRDDHGGNDLPVIFFGEALNPFGGKPWNLHAVWDTGLIDHTGLTEPAYVARLEGWLKKQSRADLQKGTVVDWALEGHRAATQVAYRLPEDRKLSRHYFEKSLPVVDALLAKAGVRLARVLNEAFNMDLKKKGAP
ncbi:MAG: S1/P1 nuclease [Nitrospirae bacterium]|nr:S1/P1 nuclease [Candidatus Manganitrophaceae bacterium]